MEKGVKMIVLPLEEYEELRSIKENFDKSLEAHHSAKVTRIHKDADERIREYIDEIERIRERCESERKREEQVRDSLKREIERLKKRRVLRLF